MNLTQMKLTVKMVKVFKTKEKSSYASIIAHKFEIYFPLSQIITII